MRDLISGLNTPVPRILARLSSLRGIVIELGASRRPRLFSKGLAGSPFSLIEEATRFPEPCKQNGFEMSIKWNRLLASQGWATIEPTRAKSPSARLARVLNGQPWALVLGRRDFLSQVFKVEVLSCLPRASHCYVALSSTRLRVA